MKKNHIVENIRKALKRVDEKTERASIMKVKCAAMVKAELTKIIGDVQSAELAIEKFYNSPSIANGSRMHEARSAANRRIDESARVICEAWHGDYNSFVSADELKRYIGEGIEELFPEREGQFWIGLVGNRLNTEVRQ